jgi:ubiquitin carboxyl-terminal hydrolase 8
MDFEKYRGKGLTGLENLGNTCFLNSCLQVLNHAYELHEFLDSKKYERNLKKNLPDTAILTEWNDLRAVMWSGNGVVTPGRFVHNVHELAQKKNRELFTGYAQNDMPEFLLFFIECLHNSIARGVNMRITGTIENGIDSMAVQCYEMLKNTYAKDYSEIMEMFYGIYVSEIISLVDGSRHALKPEPYFILNLPIIDAKKQASTLEECFQMFTAPEMLDGDNAWLNEKTGQKEGVKKQLTFWNFPKILIITLNRFSPDGRFKLNSNIAFPLTNMDLSKYVRGYKANQYVYDLFGVCNHIGGVAGGHYTAFVKNYEGAWYHYNDRRVDAIPDAAQIVSPMAYCLFYRKVGGPR